MGRKMTAGRPNKTRRAVRQWEIRERDKIIAEAKKNLTEDIEQTIMDRHNRIMLACMFAIRDELGYGKVRLIRIFKKINDHFEAILEEGKPIDELLDILEKETGLKEEDLVWTDKEEA